MANENYAEGRTPEAFIEGIEIEAELERARTIAPTEKGPSTSNERMALLKELNRMLFNEGISENRYLAIRSFGVAPGWSVRDFIEVGFDSSDVIWFGEGKERRLRAVTAVLKEIVGQIREGGLDREAVAKFEKLSVLSLMQNGMEFSNFRGLLRACITLGLLKEVEQDGTKRLVLA